MSCCRPTHNVGYCPADTCRPCTVPTYAFPDQDRFGASAALSQCMSANGVLSSTMPVMRHNQPFVLVTGTYYQFNGALFTYLATGERMGFTAHPIFPLSEAFYFRAHKYPWTGVDVTAQGVPYQSTGTVIREGDFVFLSSLASGFVLGQYKPPSPYALPYFNTPAADAIRHFTDYGTQSGETMRIVSDSFDPSLPPNEQPPVVLDGSKAYHFQFTRVGQNLQVLPGATPAPCSVRTSEFRGDSTRLIPLAPVVLYRPPQEQQAQQQQQPSANQMSNSNQPAQPTAEQVSVDASQAAEQAAAAAAQAEQQSAEAARQNNAGAAAAAANEAAAAANFGQQAANASQAAANAAPNSAAAQQAAQQANQAAANANRSAANAGRNASQAAAAANSAGANGGNRM